MDKIVIATSQAEPGHRLFTLLNTLFPECNIRFVLSEGAESVEEGAAGRSPALFGTQTVGDNHGKCSDCR